MILKTLASRLFCIHVAYIGRSENIFFISNFQRLAFNKTF